MLRARVAFWRVFYVLVLLVVSCLDIVFISAVLFLWVCLLVSFIVREEEAESIIENI